MVLTWATEVVRALRVELLLLLLSPGAAIVATAAGCSLLLLLLLLMLLVLLWGAAAGPPLLPLCCYNPAPTSGAAETGDRAANGASGPKHFQVAQPNFLSFFQSPALVPMQLPPALPRVLGQTLG